LNNVPFRLYGGIGHGAYNSNPDYTYNHRAFFDFLPLPGHVNWNNNESRTLAMELDVFGQMSQFASGQDVISAGKITQEAFEIFLGEFNAIDEHEGDGYKKDDPGSSEKVDLLQDKVDEWFGENVINLSGKEQFAYTKKAGAENRNKYLCSNGKPLDQKTYVGTILPTTCQ